MIKKKLIVTCIMLFVLIVIGAMYVQIRYRIETAPYETNYEGKVKNGSSVVTSSKYHFGKYNIGVGSSKMDVIKAYTSAGKYTFITCVDSHTYNAADKGYMLIFYFDDKDTVTKIEFSWYGDYETGF